MSRRMTKAEAQLWAWAIVIVVPIVIVVQIGEALGWGVFAAIVTVAIAASVWYKRRRKEVRRLYLTDKYQDAGVVEGLLSRSFWQGQTAEQLLDSLGSPADVDSKVLKSKRKEIWKYNHEGSNRYGLRITLENGVVVGWDQRA